MFTKIKIGLWGFERTKMLYFSHSYNLSREMVDLIENSLPLMKQLLVYLDSGTKILPLDDM